MDSVKKPKVEIETDPDEKLATHEQILKIIPDGAGVVENAEH